MDADLEPTWMYLRRVLSKALCFPASELTALLVKKMTLVILAKVIFFRSIKRLSDGIQTKPTAGAQNHRPGSTR